jgi:hypothetical protein
MGAAVGDGAVRHGQERMTTGSLGGKGNSTGVGNSQRNMRNGVWVMANDSAKWIRLYMIQNWVYTRGGRGERSWGGVGVMM